MAEAGTLNLVFMGTPDLAATVLRKVLEWPGGRVVAAYTQPDRPAGRGMALKASPVKELALSCGIPVFQPESLRGAAEQEALGALAPDYLLVAAYGLILPPAVLALPRRFPLNVHTSLLPRYRGAAPIQRAVMNGDTESGVSIMVMEKGLDSGPVVLQQRVPIGPDMTAGALHDQLADVGGDLLTAALEGLENGSLTPRAQDAEHADYAAKLSKADGAIDFSLPVERVHALVRGLTPWPGAHAFLARSGEKLLRVGLEGGKPFAPDRFAGKLTEAPGAVLGLVDGLVAIRCADGIYGVAMLKPAGRGRMDAAGFANGYLQGGQACFLPRE